MTPREREMIIEHAKKHLAGGDRADLAKITSDLNIGNMDEPSLWSITHELEKMPEVYSKGWVLFKDPKYKMPTWEETHPFWDRMRTGAITFLFSVIAIGIGWLCNRREQHLQDSQQDKRLNNLSDSIAKIQNRIDVLSDTTKSRELDSISTK